MKRFVILGICLITAACAGPGPGITGNDIGGIIPYPLVAAHSAGTSDRAVARAMAAGHCANYNKRVDKITMRRQYGEYVAFDCS